MNIHGLHGTPMEPRRVRRTCLRSVRHLSMTAHGIPMGDPWESWAVMDLPGMRARDLQQALPAVPRPHAAPTGRPPDAMRIRFRSMGIRFPNRPARFPRRTSRFGPHDIRFGPMAIRFGSMIIRYRSMGNPPVPGLPPRARTPTSPHGKSHGRGRSLHGARDEPVARFGASAGGPRRAFPRPMDLPWDGPGRHGLPWRSMGPREGLSGARSGPGTTIRASPRGRDRSHGRVPWAGRDRRPMAEATPVEAILPCRRRRSEPRTSPPGGVETGSGTGRNPVTPTRIPALPGVPSAAGAGAGKRPWNRMSGDR